MALQNGVDVKTLSCMLGHYDAGFTLRTYTHATRQMREQAAKRWETLWRRSDKTPNTRAIFFPRKGKRLRVI